MIEDMIKGAYYVKAIRKYNELCKKERINGFV